MKAWTLWIPSWGEDGPEDGRVVMADTPMEAAEEYGRHSDAQSADYTIAGGADVRMHIQGVGGPVRVYIVFAETVPVYSARLVQS